MAADQARERLDRLLVERGLAENRSQAQALIMAGRVFHETQRLEKAGQRFPVDYPLRVEAGKRWVGRGAEKLLPALERFQPQVDQTRGIDIGASTGGFTQLMLERGATEVIALDVGTNQLDYRLRQDDRVHVMEQVNARHLDQEQLPYRPQWAVADVSFISLELILPPVAACLEDGSWMLVMVKPQFEVGRAQVGRGGIVRDPALRRQALERVIGVADQIGWTLQGLHPAGLAGADGNQEYFLYLVQGAEPVDAATQERWLEDALQ